MLLRTRYEHWSAHASLQRFSAALEARATRVTERLVSNGDQDFPVESRRVRRALRAALLQGDNGYYHLSDLLAEGSVVRRAVQRRMDVVHFLDGEHTARFSPSLVRWIPGVRSVATFHQPPELLEELVPRHAVGALDMVTVMAPNQMEWFERTVGPHRVRFIPHPANVSFFRPPSYRPERTVIRCLTVGHWLRNWEVVAGVARRLAPSGLVRFDLVTSHRTGCEGIPGVRHHRGIDDATLLSLYQAADVLFLPLTSATANNALLEGMACGLPVIASDLEAIRAYVPGEAAILLSGGDADAFADAILMLRDHPEERRAMGRRARQRAEALDEGRIAAEYEALYREALGAHVASSPPGSGT